MAYWYIQRTPIKLAVDFLQQPTEVRVSAMTYLTCKKKKTSLYNWNLTFSKFIFQKMKVKKRHIMISKTWASLYRILLSPYTQFPLFCISVSIHILSVSVSSFQSLSPVWLFVAPFTAAWQAYLSITNSQSLLKTHVHRVSDAIQPSYPLLSPSHPSFNLSQHQSLFQWVSSLHQVV